MLLSKVFQLANRPHEITGRVWNKVDDWMDHFSATSALPVAAPPQDLIAQVAHLLQVTPASISTLTGFSGLEEHIAERCGDLLERPGPFANFLNGTPTLGRLCYLACRQLRPRMVVETGVAYGATSAYILQALEDNGFGELSSIDLPPLRHDADRYIGYLIPFHLRHRWKLRMGSARDVLPRVLSEAGSVDVFVHDSLHTYRNMKWEFGRALATLRRGGLLISDDIEVNRAFEETIHNPTVGRWVAIQEDGKNATCGAMRVGGF